MVDNRTYQQVLDRYGAPNSARASEGIVHLAFGSGAESLCFEFCDGFVLNVDSH